MARIIIIGGHGKVALLAAPMLVTRGHEVTGVIRNPAHAADVEAAGATPLTADVESLSTDALADIVAGFDAIVWSAGAGGGSPERTKAVDEEAAIRSVDAASVAGVPRYVMVSYFGAGPEHGVDPSSSFSAYAQAKAAADAHLHATSLDWTILKPSTLTLETGSGEIDAVVESDRARTSAEASGPVSRSNVAAVLTEVLCTEPGALRGVAFAFVDGSTPIPEAIEAAAKP